MLLIAISAWHLFSNTMKSCRVRANKVRELREMRFKKAAALFVVVSKPDSTDKLLPTIKHLQELITIEEECEQKNVHNFSKEHKFMDILAPLQGIAWHYIDSPLNNDLPLLNRLCCLKELVERLTKLWLKTIKVYKGKTFNIAIGSWFNADVIIDGDIFAMIPPDFVDVDAFSRSTENIRNARGRIFEGIEIIIRNAEVKRYQLEKIPLQLYPRIANVERLQELNPMNFSECCICLTAICIEEDNIAVLQNCPHIFCAPCIRKAIKYV